MSWRETMGIGASSLVPSAHNSQKAQNSVVPGNCANSAHSALGDSEDEHSKLLEILATACQGLDISPIDVFNALAGEDIQAWRDGEIGETAFAAFAGLLIEQRHIQNGRRPPHFTNQAVCQHCGPIWPWFSGEVSGCPWCRNRTKGVAIPRPCSVHCGECSQFERIEHPHLGHCAKGEPEPLAGLWDSDHRYCVQFLPKPKRSQDGHMTPTRSEGER